MANVKRITIDYGVKGHTVYCIVRREADKYLLDNATGSFGAAPGDPYIDLVEDGTMRGRYERDENRQVWNNGKYTILAYDNLGTETPLADTVIGDGAMFIVSDAEATEDLTLLGQASLATATNLGLVKTATDKLTFDASNNVKSVQQFPGGSVVADGGNGTSSFKTDLSSSVNDYWKGTWLKFTSGALINQIQKVTGYNGTTKYISFSTPFTGIPAGAVTFDLVNS